MLVILIFETVKVIVKFILTHLLSYETFEQNCKQFLTWITLFQTLMQPE